MKAARIAILVICAAWLTGCRCKRVEVVREVVRVDTAWQSVKDVRHDTLTVRELDSVTVYIKGDTVRETRWKIVETERVVYVERGDSVASKSQQTELKEQTTEQADEKDKGTRAWAWFIGALALLVLAVGWLVRAFR